MVKTVYLLCGPAGSGKSTWAEKNAGPNDKIISRDEIRFSLVKVDEDYFSREDEVIKKFITNIRWAMDAENHDAVFIDATHLTRKARTSILYSLNLENVSVVPVVFKTPLATCLNQNGQRKGRKKVPDAVVANMYNRFEDPKDDMLNYEKIIYINQEGESNG